MLEAFRKAFKIKDIRKKIGYTFLMLIVIRIGSQLPTPGVNGEYIKNSLLKTLERRSIYLTPSPVALLSKCLYLP